MESSVEAFLISAIPSWQDDLVSFARFKAFAGQRSDWEPRYFFWRDAIISVARHLDLLIIDTHQVQHFWFLRRGVTPLCINQVLIEMYKDGNLKDLDNYESNMFSAAWFWQRISKGFFLKSQETNVNNDMSKKRRLAVTNLVHERLLKIANTVSENCWTASCLTTMSHFLELSGGQEEAELIKKEMVQTKKGRVFTTEGNISIQGIKFSGPKNPVLDIDKVDCYLLQLYWTQEKLISGMNIMEKAYSRSKQCALKCIQSKDRNSAKTHVYSMRRLSASKAKCLEFQDKIHEVLVFISEAEMSKQVFEAMKVGNEALKEHMLSLEDIQVCLQEVEETVSLQREAASALGFQTGDRDDELELEVAELELSMLNKDLEIETPSRVDSLPHKMNHDAACEATAVEDVKDLFKHLSLEPEPA